MSDQGRLFDPVVETWDLEGVPPAAMTRDQLARALQAALSRGLHDPAVDALLSAAVRHLAERTYLDATDRPRCALCLQEIRP